MPHEVFIHIHGPKFAAVIHCRNGIVVAAAGAVSYMMGWTDDEVLGHVKERGWDYRLKPRLQLQ